MCTYSLQMRSMSYLNCVTINKFASFVVSGVKQKVLGY